MTGHSRRFCFAFLIAALACVASASRAQTAADFFAGKRVNLFIGAGEGASYDLAARVFARRLREFLPGSPTIVPQNMPGASQVRATEYVFNIAPRDGTSLLVAQPSIVLNRLLNPAARYDVHGFAWIGRVQPTVGMGVVWTNSGVRSIEDARTREVIMGANSPTGPQSMLPMALNVFAGTRFKVVRGYESEHRALLAMERGEIHGIGNVMSDYLFSKDGPVTRGTMRPLYAAGLTRLKRAPETPTVVELASSEPDRAVMRLMAAISELGLNLMASPGIPPERVEALRRAFDAMVADPAFREEIGRLGFEPEPMSGLALTGFVAENFAPAPELVARMKAAAIGE